MPDNASGSPAVARRFRFTEARLAALTLAPTEARRIEYTDADAGWFRCRVGARDRVLFVVRKQRGAGRLVRHRLGAVGDKPLQAYRIEGERIAAALAAGATPESATVPRGALTAQKALDNYLAAKNDKLAALTIASYEADFAALLGSWTARPLAALDAATVARLHRERSAASKARADGGLRILRAVHRYASTALQTEGKEALRDPLALITAAKAWNGTVRKTSRLEDHTGTNTRPAWLAAVRALPDDDGRALTGAQRDALLLLAATGLRLREGLRLTWQEVDLRRGVLTLSAERMKGNREHSLPLPRRTLAMLKARRAAANDAAVYVFAGRGGEALDRISKWTFDAIAVRATPHDLRRTAATWLGMNAPAYAVKAILSHADPAKSPDVTAGYIDPKPDDLRPWVQRWEDALYGAKPKARRG